MDKSRREFLGKGPTMALAAGVGVASGVAIASGKTSTATPTASEGTRQLLDDFIHGQASYNGNFYSVDERLLEVLRMIIPHVPMIDAAAATAKLDEAQSTLDKACEAFPPGCCSIC